MILVTAAHGNQGRLLVPKLLAADQLVRACVRTQASAEHLRGLGAHEIVVGDISDPAVLARAIRGVQKVHHIGPTIHPRVRATVSAWARPSLGAGARPFHAPGSPDGAGVGESVLGDAAERLGRCPA